SPARGADGFWVYGALGHPFFPPGLVPPYVHRIETLDGSAVAWSTDAAPGDPDSNWTYMIIAVDAAGQELARSNRAGEFDYAASIP
ncbi:MAG: hypothetical protein MUE60_13590, partial [Candidatus Eisenbacteria bacterium]|nr:hypothetical protein [Candidatus Eisenbacteria bacterium]